MVPCKPSPACRSQFVREFGLTFDIWLDPEGRIQDLYRSPKIPESFVINRDGVIVRKVIGGTEWDSEANVESFRRHTQFPSEGGAAPASIEGVGWSDHWSFWKEGYPAVMVTDTAPLRYPHYHTPRDTPEKVSYDFLTRVVDGLEAVVPSLARSVT